MPFMPWGEPQSVPDPDGDAYDEMLRRYRLQQAQDPDSSDDAIAAGQEVDQLVGSDGDDHLRTPEADVSVGVSPLAREQPRYGSTAGLDAWDATEAITPVDWTTHPGFLESLVPVWGSGREAIANGNDGNYPGAAFATALGALDLLPIGHIGTALGKAGIQAALKDGASMAYGAVRKRMGRAGYFAAGEHAHHWAIPQSWKWVPDAVRNHPMNLKPLAAEIHKRLHGNDLVNGLPRFNWLERLHYGMPDWAKDLSTWTAGSVGSKAVNAASRDDGAPAEH